MVRFTNLGLGGRGELKCDINVTPLVAVIVVLLIYLMLITPFSSHGVVGPLLPLAVHTVDRPDPRMHDVTVVGIKADRMVFLDSVPVRLRDLAKRITESLEKRKDKRVLLVSDRDTPYATVMAAMDSLRKAQVKEISLIVRDARSPEVPQ